MVQIAALYLPEVSWKRELLSFLPKGRRERILGSHTEKQALSRLYADLLLTDLLRDRGAVGLMETIRTGRNGKPDFAEGDLHFNLSHTDTMVVLALSEDGPVGIDAEPAGRSVRVPERFFSEEDRLHAEGDDGLLRLWCRKEALVKCSGGSIVSKEACTAVVHRDTAAFSGKTCFLSDLSLPHETIGCLCTERPVSYRITEGLNCKANSDAL